MSKSQIELKREAGELREKFREGKESLREQIVAQRQGEISEEDESYLTPEEISEQQDELEGFLKEAKALERMDSLDGIADRLEEEGGKSISPVVREILAEAGFQAGQKAEAEAPFENMHRYLKAFHRLSTGRDNGVGDISEREQAKLQQLAKGATALDRGEPFSEKDLGDEELKQMFEAKTLGGGGGSTTGGAALVPNVHMTELLRAMGESQQFANRARRVPMARRTIDFPRLDQTDASDDRPIYSIAAISKVAEGAQKTEREPSFSQFTLSAVKYVAYLEASDELLEESIVDVRPLIVQLLTDATAFEYDRDTMRGSGSSEPQGFIGSSAELALARNGANAIDTDDVFTMESKFFGTEGIYLHHPSVIPQIYGLSQDNIIVWNPDLADDVPGTLLGRPLVRTHKLPQLGTKGDLNLVDPSFYIAGDLQSITIATSTDFKFRNDLTAWRSVFRAAGSPWPAGTFSHEASGGSKTYEVSPFVVLADTGGS